MTTGALLGIELAAALGSTAAWFAAAVQALALRGACDHPRRARLALLVLGGAALVLTVVRLVSVVALANAGWWFAAEKVTFTLPIAAGTCLLAAIRLRSADPFPLFVAGYGAALGLVTTLVVGYPLSAANIVGLLGALTAATAVTWAALRRPSTTVIVVAGVAAFAVAATVTTGWLDARAGEAHLANAGGVRIDQLRTGGGTPDQTITLTASRLGDDWVFNGQSPGPLIAAQVGELIQIELRNIDIESGVTLHWHGYPVPAGEDGVAGITQDRVGPGETFTYRLLMDTPGTYWYHGHQHSGEAIRRGLFGGLVVRAPGETGAGDITALIHRGALRLSDDQPQDQSPVRFRVVNTDSKPHAVAVSGAPYRIVSVDGRDLHGPQLVDGQEVPVPAGGRVDLSYQHSSTAQVLLDPGLPRLDLLTYGMPETVPPAALAFDRAETLVLDRQLRFFNGGLQQAYPINGKLFPDVPPLKVREGQLVKLTVINRGFDTHPMHPHGHQVQVISRNGQPVTGTPLWLDTFDVKPGEVWVVALRADNPGVWLSHCHDLSHAAAGMVLHLEYDGYHSPYTVGGHNHPE